MPGSGSPRASRSCRSGGRRCAAGSAGRSRRAAWPAAGGTRPACPVRSTGGLETRAIGPKPNDGRPIGPDGRSGFGSRACTRSLVTARVSKARATDAEYNAPYLIRHCVGARPAPTHRRRTAGAPLPLRRRPPRNDVRQWDAHERPPRPTRLPGPPPTAVLGPPRSPRSFGRGHRPTGSPSTSASRAARASRSSAGPSSPSPSSPWGPSSSTARPARSARSSRASAGPCRASSRTPGRAPSADPVRGRGRRRPDDRRRRARRTRARPRSTSPARCRSSIIGSTDYTISLYQALQGQKPTLIEQNVAIPQTATFTIPGGQAPQGHERVHGHDRRAGRRELAVEPGDLRPRHGQAEADDHLAQGRREGQRDERRHQGADPGRTARSWPRTATNHTSSSAIGRQGGAFTITVAIAAGPQRHHDHGDRSGLERHDGDA